MPPERDPSQSRIGNFIDGVKDAFATGVDRIHSGIDQVQQNIDSIKAVGKIAALGLSVSLGLTGVALAAESAPAGKTPSTPEAEASAGHGMQPSGVIRGLGHILVIRAGGSFNDSTIHLRKASLTDDEISFNGKCDVKNNRGNSWIARTITDQAGKLVTDYCYQKSYTYKHDPVDYSPYLQRLGSKAAASVGSNSTTHGDATRIAATKKQARINFAQNPNAPAGIRELRSLTLRRGKTPLRTFY